MQNPLFDIAQDSTSPGVLSLLESDHPHHLRESQRIKTDQMLNKSPVSRGFFNVTTYHGVLAKSASVWYNFSVGYTIEIL